jgi:C-terminal processing protease CtpA/Prc
VESPTIGRFLHVATVEIGVIDARRNGGGSPESVTHLVSYFVADSEPVHINTFINRTPETDTFTTREFWSETAPFSYLDKPVYVLTSDFTFSGSEEFAPGCREFGLITDVGTHACECCLLGS